MRVEIPVAFEVESREVELDECEAETAAALAAYDFLSFCKISGYSTDSDSVEVHVDGIGKCTVKLSNETP